MIQFLHMGVCLDAYRASIECFALCLPSILRKITIQKHFLVPSRVISSRFQAILAFSLVVIFLCLLVLAGDIEVNPRSFGRQQHAVNSSVALMRHTPSSDSVSSGGFEPSAWLTHHRYHHCYRLLWT